MTGVVATAGEMVIEKMVAEEMTAEMVANVVTTDSMATEAGELRGLQPSDGW